MRIALASLVLLALSSLAAAAPAPLARRTTVTELTRFEGEVSRARGKFQANGLQLIGVRRGLEPREWIVLYVPGRITYKLGQVQESHHTHEMTLIASTPEEFAAALHETFG